MSESQAAIKMGMCVCVCMYECTHICMTVSQPASATAGFRVFRIIPLSPLSLLLLVLSIGRSVIRTDGRFESVGQDEMCACAYPLLSFLSSFVITQNFHGYLLAGAVQCSAGSVVRPLPLSGMVAGLVDVSLQWPRGSECGCDGRGT